jgi:hypothetical protein
LILHTTPIFSPLVNGIFSFPPTDLDSSLSLNWLPLTAHIVQHRPFACSPSFEPAHPTFKRFTPSCTHTHSSMPPI